MKKLAQILTVVVLTLSMYSCYDFPVMIAGTGPVVTKEFTVESFDKVVAETVIDVEIVSVPFYLNNSLAYQLIIRDISEISLLLTANSVSIS